VIVVKDQKAAIFLGRTEDRLGRLEERLGRLLGDLPLPEQARAAVSQALQNARSRIQDVGGLIEAGDIDGAMDGFDDVLGNMGMSMEALGGNRPGVADNLQALDKIDATIALLEDRLGDLEGKGVDVSHIAATLETAKGLLEAALGNLYDEDSEAADSALDMADELVDEAEGIMEQAREDAEEQGERANEEAEQARGNA